jgi:hypothetical protein
MTSAVDPRRVAAEALHDAILDARHIAGDGAVCDALDMLGAAAGQQRYRYAAAAIRGLPPGPKVAAPVYGSTEWRALIASIIRIRGRRCEDPQCQSTNRAQGHRV